MFLATFSFQSPAFAAVTDWAVSDGGRMRIAALREPEPGKITAILDIELNSGWKTYWKNPGDAGVPPQLDFSGSKNIELTSSEFPIPEIGKDEGGSFTGYHHPVQLVLDLKVPDPAKGSSLSANVLIGVCKNICLPFQGSFNLDLPAGQSSPVADEFMKIALAKAALPEKPAEGFKVETAKLSLKAGAVDLKIRIPGKENPQIVINPLGKARFGTPEIRNDPDGYFYVRLPERSGNYPLSAELLVKSGTRAIETRIDAGLDKTLIDGEKSP